MKIRPATVADAGGLAETLTSATRGAFEGLVPRRCYETPSVAESADNWLRFLGSDACRSGKEVLLVAEDESRILGLVLFGGSTAETRRYLKPTPAKSPLYRSGRIPRGADWGACWLVVLYRPWRCEVTRGWRFGSLNRTRTVRFTWPRVPRNLPCSHTIGTATAPAKWFTVGVISPSWRGGPRGIRMRSENINEPPRGSSRLGRVLVA